MTRRGVIDEAGSIHFVTFSTYQRRRFLDSPETRDIVLEVLEKFLITREVACLGFVIMPNHVHAMFMGKDGFNISSFLQVWKKTSSYRIREFFERELVKYMNLCPGNCAIWQSGFYDRNLDSDEKRNEKLKYMHQNPVTAGLAEGALDWNWSSARFYELDEPVGVTITR